MGATPTLSLQLRNFAKATPDSWQTMMDQAVAADRAGIGKVVVSDHVAFGSALDDYANPTLGGTKGGRQPTGPDGDWLEPLTVLSVIAGMTTQVRLGTAILLAALRRPVVLAKSLATLDVLAGGRVDLGVGVGWQAAEYDAAGLDFSGRGRLLDHTLEVCQALWSGESIEYDAPELSFGPTQAMPRPAQAGGIPIWVSGTVNPRAMQRLATFGQGWIPWGPAVGDVVSGIADMRKAVEDLGRDPRDIAVTGTLPVVRTDDGVDLATTMRAAPALIEAGVTDLRIYLGIPAGVDAATEYLSGVVEHFAAATT